MLAKLSARPTLPIPYTLHPNTISPFLLHLSTQPYYPLESLLVLELVLMLVLVLLLVLVLVRSGASAGANAEVLIAPQSV